MADSKSPNATPGAASAAKAAPDEVEQRLGPIEPIADELLASPSDVPIVESRRSLPSRGGGEARSSSPALWFFGAVVTALLALQTVQLFLAPRGAANAATAATDGNAPPATAAPQRTSEQEVSRLLYESRVQMSAHVYEDAVRILEPLVADPTRLDQWQRWEAYLLLARAHRALGNVERAQAFYLRATDQSVDRREPALVLEDSGELAADGRYAEAREKLCELLARRDGLAKRDLPFAGLAEARLADTWYAQALASGQVRALPGGSAEEQR
ncbi:MAG: hypothetical protein JNL90_05845 [Planctomycetes bacterium]|nr:hypothetical protein [Planctomycetota bacterium]